MATWEEGTSSQVQGVTEAQFNMCNIWIPCETRSGLHICIHDPIWRKYQHSQCFSECESLSQLKIAKPVDMSVQAQELSHCGQHTITHMWKTKQLLSDDASFDRSCLFGLAPLRFAVLFWRKWILEVSVELVAQNFDTLWSKMYSTENISLTSHTVTLPLLVLLPKDRMQKKICRSSLCYVWKAHRWLAKHENLRHEGQHIS